MGHHVRERESYAREFEMVEITGLRARVERAIATLIDLLDGLDGDPDAEDGVDREEDTDLTEDCELDHGEWDIAEYGIADLDGLEEQYGPFFGVGVVR